MSGEDLEALRPGALAIAYRMLGSVSSAEDVVQEGLLRLQMARDGGEQIASPSAYLATVVTRLAIDELRSARVRREEYVGQWLPEPIVTSPADDPSWQLETADSLSIAFLVLLERLTPEQRAVFLLREVFDYSYDEIGEVIGRTPSAARQLASRARTHVDEGRPRFEASPAQQERLADRFFEAIGDGDLAKLERLLAADVAMRGDGGGNAPAAPRPILGRVRVARTLVAFARNTPPQLGFTLERVQVNRQSAGLVLDPDGRLVVVMVLGIAEGQIHEISNVLNPDKLGHLGRPIADLAALLRDRPSDRRLGPPPS